MEIKLKTINIEDKEKLLEMLKEYEESELIPNIDRYEGIRSFELLNDMKFEEWLAKIKKEEITCPKEFSTHTLYMALDENDQIIGIIDNRWNEVPVLMEFGGLIGYSVRPSKRGNGFANQMLKLSLSKMWESGKKEVLISCKDFNIASKRTIEKNNGKYIETYHNEEDGYVYLKYIIYKENN